MSAITLAQIIQYRNEDVLSRFTDLFDVTDEEAEDLFIETKKFLFICRQPGVFIPDELLIVDEMWHNFILFTKEYQDFCTFYFGGYLHHTPSSKVAKIQHRQALAADATTVRQTFHEQLATLMSVTYDHLGRDTVIKWFQHYPVQYSKETIKKLRKH